MRLPHYLYRTPSGIWQFRQRVPVDMASHLGCRYLKKSLKTRDLQTAQRLALDMAEAYAPAIRMTRGLGVSMSMDGKASVDAAVTAVRNGKDYMLIRRPDGSIEIEAKGRADHELALEAAARIGPLSAEPLVQKIVAEARRKPAASGPDIPDLAIRIAIDEWLGSIKPTTLKKTLSIKAAAVGSFARHYGVRKPLAGAGRVEVDPAAHHSTALLHAAHRGHWPCVELLLPVSDPNERNAEALWRACKHRHTRVVRLLAPASDTSGWEGWMLRELSGASRALLDTLPARRL